jgi:transcriptional regulator with XRE-family HTH domain
MYDNYELTFGEVLKELREFQGYTQKEVSTQLNITSQAYSNYETNKRTPDMEMTRKIAQFYGKTIDQLIECRYTRQIEDSRNYAANRSLYRGVSDTGIVIPMTGKQAKMVTDILSLPPEQQDACQKLIELMIMKSNS